VGFQQNFSPSVPLTARIVVTICRQYFANASVFPFARHVYQPPLNSQPGRKIVSVS
jgi:hypothetical protein